MMTLAAAASSRRVGRAQSRIDELLAGDEHDDELGGVLELLPVSLQAKLDRLAGHVGGKLVEVRGWASPWTRSRRGSADVVWRRPRPAFVKQSDDHVGAEELAVGVAVLSWVEKSQYDDMPASSAPPEGDLTAVAADVRPCGLGRGGWFRCAVPPGPRRCPLRFSTSRRGSRPTGERCTVSLVLPRQRLGDGLDECIEGGLRWSSAASPCCWAVVNRWAASLRNSSVEPRGPWTSASKVSRLRIWSRSISALEGGLTLGEGSPRSEKILVWASISWRRAARSPSAAPSAGRSRREAR